MQDDRGWAIPVLTQEEPIKSPCSLTDGNIRPGHGQPGTIFAKVLRDVQTGESPVVSYWKQTLIASDNRLPTLGSDRSTYRFAVPSTGGHVSIAAQLLFRRAPWSILETKDWDRPDIVMEESRVTLTATPYWSLYLPLVTR